MGNCSIIVDISIPAFSFVSSTIGKTDTVFCTPRGQQEAGLVLGMTKSQIFFKVTLLQMIKRIVPPISNEVITLVKDTSLASKEKLISFKTFVDPKFFSMFCTSNIAIMPSSVSAIYCIEKRYAGR